MHGSLYVTAIVPAGGRGLRVGGARPKQLLVVGGRPLLERSVAAFLTHPLVDQLIVALPVELADSPPPYLRGTAKPLRVVGGGARRQDSVANAFQAIDDRTELVVIHDAARPFVSASLIDRTIAAAVEAGAAVAALQARDTVKKGDGGIVQATLPRESIFLVQTPQAFRREILRDALALGARGVEATDEAALVERAGHTVRLVEGEASNIKVTTADDLPIAEAIALGVRDRPWPADAGLVGAGNVNAVRVGLGYDLHRLVEGRPLILGGVTIPCERGLSGHSDADAVCHAITDAVLGAGAARDIGWHFPDTDPRWRGASSLDLLRGAVEIVRGLRYEVVNVDVVVIAERPRLGPYVDAMRANVATVLGIAADAVSIKGKTNEGVGELGRGEAIAVHATAAIRSVEPGIAPGVEPSSQR